jgi:MYXO-CTERM domain-containing protein
MPFARRAGRTRFVLGAAAFGASGVATALLFAGRAAHAYCRTTTCGSEKSPDCADPSKCPSGGAPIYWPQSRVSIGVENGSALRGISAETARDVLSRSINAWTSVDCGGRPPSIAVAPIEIVLGGGSSSRGIRFDAAGDSQNTLHFVDDGWPHESSAIALTTVRYGLESGKIVAADIEANSADYLLTVVDSGGNFDLESVLTHEAGHFFGLAHVNERPPTMFAMYSGGGNIDRRTLEDNDRQGICAVYAPNRFGDDSGCACTVGRAPSPWRLWAWLPLAAFVLRRRRREPT